MSRYDNNIEDSNFDRLLKRYLANEVTDAEKKKIEAWLDSNKLLGDKKFIWDDRDEEILFQKITEQSDNIDEILSYRPRFRQPRSFFTLYWKQMAAALVLVAAFAAGAYYLLSTGTNGDYKTAGENSKAILHDGTIVWLRDHSSLSYHTEQNIRHVEFTGEALFEVAKNPGQPFVISTGKIRVTVLGTSFHLKTHGDTIDLILLTGKVNLASNTASVDVVPGEMVQFTSNGLVAKQTAQHRDIVTATSQTEYSMVFENATMDLVLDRLIRKFDLNLTVRDRSLLNCHLRADLTDQSLETTLQMISEVLDFKYTIEGKNLVVKGSGCN